MSRITRHSFWIGVFFLFLFALITYAPKIQSFGYYNDDWWQIYGGENFGIQRFPEMYASDRPARAYWHAFLFSIFGSQILPYQILALGIRLLGSIGLFWTLTLVWKKRIIEVILMSILFLVYPGFLEQPNGFDYQTHQVAITSFVFSIGFSILSINSKFIGRKILFFLISSSLSIITFFFMEYYVGLEIYRWLLIGCIYLRENLKINRKIVFQYILKVIPYSFSMFFFVFWRIFLFESSRYATDVNRIKIELLSSPFLSFFNIGRRWISDIGDIFFKVWSKQGYKNVFELRSSDLVIAFLLGFIAIGLLFLLIKFFENNLVIKRDEINQDDNKKNNWAKEAMFIGFIGAILCLIPINVTGREVDFPTFNRFSFPSSIGVSIAFIGFIFFTIKIKWQYPIISLLIFSSLITHYSNNVYFANRWKETQNFWQQWIWRVPSLKEGAILTGFYSETIQEGYFIWSPVNLIYFQDTTNAKVGAEVLNEETIREIQMGNSFEKNFRSFDLDFDTVNLLVFSKPTPESCLRFLDHKQIELSIYDKILISNVSPYAKINPIEHTNTADKLMFNRLFGSESDELSWCFIYENASLARQFGDWDEIINLHTQAREKDLKPFDPIEWFPFLQAYAYKGMNDEVDQLVPIINETPYYRHQACSIFSQKDIDPDPAIQSGNQYLAESFCD